MSASTDEKYYKKNQPEVLTDSSGRIISVKPKSNKTQHRQAALLTALYKTFGVVTKACELAGVDRTMYYHWYNGDEEFKRRADSLNDFQIDFVESKLLQRINDGDTQAIIFFLSTKGKRRGYEKLDPAKEAEQLISNAVTINEIVVDAIPQIVEPDNSGGQLSLPESST